MATSFDRSGFQQDCNIVFPIDRLRKLEEQGVIGSLADYHYSFGTPLSTYNAEIEAGKIAGFLKKDNVNAALLFPV
jgi:D-proline reductase (dithiol) PrdB